jgi:hypothetical protein
MRTSATVRGLLVPAAILLSMSVTTTQAAAQVTSAQAVSDPKRRPHTGESDASAGRGRSADVYVKVQPVKGAHRVIRCPDGYCTASNLAAGRYMVSLSTADGVDVASDATLSYNVLTAREAGSGMATGKRQHQPLKITKEWDRSLPQNMIEVVEAGSTLDLQVRATINTTRSNIKRLDE